MLKYLKEVGKNKFVLIQSKTADSDTINSPDDLFKYRMNMNFDKLYYIPLKFNITY